MSRLFALAAAALVGAACVPGAVQAAYIINGGFESPTPSNFASYPPYSVPPDYVYPGPSVPVMFDNWTYFSGAGLVNVTDPPNAWYNGSPPSGYQGNQFAFLQGNGSLTQTFTATAGLSSLQWLEGSRPDLGCCNGAQSYQVFLNSVLLGTFSTPSDEDFTFRTIGVTLLASNTLVFQGLAATDSTAFIDAVNISAIPEPSTWAMMLLGFAGLGVMAFRRSKRSAAVAA